jgi:hypothetical protein
VTDEKKPETGEVSHDEAEQIALAYVDHAFGNPEKPGRRIRHCIPANPREDTDIRLMAYIKQQRQQAASLAAADAKIEALEAELELAWSDEHDPLPKRVAELTETLLRSESVANAELTRLTAERDSERAGRERLEASRQATLDILCEEYPKLGAEWRSCLAFVFGALGANETFVALQASTPAPPSEGLCGHLIRDGQTPIGACQRGAGHDGEHQRGVEAKPICPETYCVLLAGHEGVCRLAGEPPSEGLG